MKVYFENVNFRSLSGPNSFANKLAKYLLQSGVEIVDSVAESDKRLCFIETRDYGCKKPIIQRLDGIYFNLLQDYKAQNSNIQQTFKHSSAVVYQTSFNQKLINKFFGVHEKSVVIPNGADLKKIEAIPALVHTKLDKFKSIWSCASHWRPHKRLDDNIRYFLEHSSLDECLVVAGDTNKNYVKNDRIFYIGSVSHEKLISLYKASKYFIHLSWLDHCPNVVVDARASGCQVICSSAGGTVEIAGENAIVIEEDEWDFKPVRLYDPPPLNFDKKVKNTHNSDYNMETVAAAYKNFMESVI